MINPHRVHVEHLGSFSKSFHGIECAVNGVFEQMPAIERNHRDEVCEPEQDIDPHKPKEEIDQKHQSTDPQNRTNSVISSIEH